MFQEQIGSAIAAATKAAAQRRAAEDALSEATAELAQLRTTAKQLSKDAMLAEAEASKEASALAAMPMAVAAGTLSYAVAAARLRDASESLPAMDASAMRLLGLQLGAGLVNDADTVTPVDGQTWIPVTDEDVLVRFA